MGSLRPKISSAWVVVRRLPTVGYANDRALSRLVASGKLRRLGRGLYDFPRQSGILKGAAPARLDAVVEAISLLLYESGIHKVSQVVSSRSY